MDKRLQEQIAFLIEADKMKNILRRTLVMDGSRPENDAEHSWHFSLMAMILYEYADKDKVDLLRVLKMAIVHDLVEIYAGDTFAYDTEGYESKAERENAAADKLFGPLPEDIGLELRNLWEEFDRMDTPDSLYAAAIDRFQPFLSNLQTDGFTWKDGNVTSEMVFKRLEPVKHAAPGLWDFVLRGVEDSVAKGYLI